MGDHPDSGTVTSQPTILANGPESPLSMGSPDRHQQHHLEPTRTSRAVTANSSRNSPEPVQTDQQGHYVGPSSGAAFLLRIQRRLQQQPSAFSSDSSIFTFGDLPLQEPRTPRFLILPPRVTADALLRTYFEFGAATHRFLHRPTVEAWLDELYETDGVMRDQATAASKTALLFMVFASAESYPRKTSGGQVDPAAR